jgi:hypothetical protein
MCLLEFVMIKHRAMFVYPWQRNLELSHHETLVPLGLFRHIAYIALIVKMLQTTVNVAEM